MYLIKYEWNIYDMEEIQNRGIKTKGNLLAHRYVII